MISTRGRYALRFMIDIAVNGNGSFIPLKDVAERQGISKKYLEIIAKELVSGGLLQALSGRSGGYRLSKSPNEYSLEEILTLTEGSLSPVACLADKSYNCPRREYCKTLPLWAEYDELIHSFFRDKRLSDLL